MATRSVGDVAKISGITVRTLHHYDEIGLLQPSERRANGYRYYTDSDLGRLQEILTYRELGLVLDEISDLLDQPSNRTEALGNARARILERIDRLQQIAASLGSAIEAGKRGSAMTMEERLEVFGDFDPAEVAHEAEEHWGGTDAYAESARRTNSYTKQDWKRQKAAEAQIYRALLALMRAEVSPTSEEASALVDAHRALITEWFYECTPAIHKGLGEMYARDVRFSSNINKAGEGVADYLSAAIAARYSD